MSKQQHTDTQTEIQNEAQNIAQFATRLGDDALITGQRLCEWCAKAPTLEEDLALANVALDYLGRARMCYGYAGELLGKDEDHFAYQRHEPEFENALIVELPRGDFAFTMVRQYLLDEFEVSYFQALISSGDSTFAGIAAKTHKEVLYHQRRSLQWIKRLGLGTAESNRRSQEALDELWGYVDELFEMDSLENTLADQGIVPNRQTLKNNWHKTVSATLSHAELSVPDSTWQVQGGREGVHTEHLGHLLAEMQSLSREHPGLTW